MKLLTVEIHNALRSNSITAGARELRGEPFDPVPLVKLFNPVGAATWLVTEIAEDCDTLFGLADLGFGCPELGSFSLDELSAIRLPFGLTIERDVGFDTSHRLSIWAIWALRSGSIIEAERMLRNVANGTDVPP